jgi:exodeoxyribonuclease VII small subunit
MPFEDALQRLEHIVDTMESEELSLDTLLAHFEEGAHLAKLCQAKLADAELRVQKLEKNSAGEMALKPLSPDLVADEQ